MLPKQFIDPLGSKLPALEQNILKLRAMQMLLVLFYAEELKRRVLKLIQATDRVRGSLQGSEASPERVPPGTKNAVDKALKALVADGAITAADKAEIVQLIDYRNAIGHQMHDLLADVSTEPVAREIITHAPDLLIKYDHNAVERLQHFRKLLGGLYRTHHYVTELNYNALLFRSAERTFLAEIRRLRRKIFRLIKIRQAEIERVNAELSLKGTELEADWHPRHPLSQYDDGRLTKRGVEICYRLFDMGKSTMAVAHITGLSLIAARKRQRMWAASGGMNRVKVDIATIPRRKFYARHED
jgi:hypothetical protein